MDILLSTVPKLLLNSSMNQSILTVKYYEYVIVHVDNIFCISHQPQLTMNAIAELY